MFGSLYERALCGEPCVVRDAHAGVTALPVAQWVGDGVGDPFDDAVVGLSDGPTLELGCGPGRLLARLQRAGCPVLGVDCSPRAVQLARARGVPALCTDVFGSVPDAGYWGTVLLIDGCVGLGADPQRILRRAGELLGDGGSCVAEFDPHLTGVTVSRVRLEIGDDVGPWFTWASVGLDCADELAGAAGLRLKEAEVVGDRAVVSLARI
ncbi:MAG: methyltransferase domain-containing protein [Mycobacterium sp.]|nr:methyltransferase domain-containing protein [Mycobacterium sp.]